MPKSQQCWVQSQHPPTQWIWGAADEAVLSIHRVLKTITSGWSFRPCTILSTSHTSSRPLMRWDIHVFVSSLQIRQFWLSSACSLVLSMLWTLTTAAPGKAATYLCEPFVKASEVLQIKSLNHLLLSSLGYNIWFLVLADLWLIATVDLRFFLPWPTSDFKPMVSCFGWSLISSPGWPQASCPVWPLTSCLSWHLSSCPG